MIGGVAYSDWILAGVAILGGAICLFRPERPKKGGDRGRWIDHG